MPYYYRLGNVPPKRHTQHRSADGALYHEELVSTLGFSSIYSLVYHVYPPTRVKHMGPVRDLTPKVAVAHNMQHRLLSGFSVPPADDYLASRTPVLVNGDCQILLAAPKHSTTDYFFKNASADELIFVHEGSGRLKTAFGTVPFKYGDYVHVPRGVIYQMQFDGPDNRLLILESNQPIHFPKRYLSKEGQLLEHSPYCERDIVVPHNLQTHDELGDFRIFIKKGNQLYDYIYANHPFDYAGWDGFFYPYATSIHDFEPITGRVHQPPPVHQHFETSALVVCSFVPRLFDYHPLSIPAPYHHSNVDSDEVLYYVDGDFMSRNNIGRGMITLHPMGIPHGPAPGAIERSIGAKDTQELAVMIDTFAPLQLTQAALDIENGTYWNSWMTS